MSEGVVVDGAKWRRKIRKAEPTTIGDIARKREQKMAWNLRA